MKWFRFYEGALDDPKVQRLSDALFKTWVNLLCLAARNGGRLSTIEEIGFALRLSEREAKRRVAALIDAGLIDCDDDGMAPHNWGARQYESDRSAERVKRFRERQNGRDGNGKCNVTSMLPVSPPETETETEKKEREAPAPAVPALNSKRGTRLPDGWEVAGEDAIFASATLGSPLLVQNEADKFRDHWRSAPGSKGVKLDWSGTWRNWVRRAAEQSPRSRGHPLGRQKRPGFADLLRDNLDEPDNHDQSRASAGPDLRENTGLRGVADPQGRSVVVDLRSSGSGWG